MKKNTVDEQFQEYLRRVKKMTARPEPTTDALVPVRAHFRRQKNYCNKKPELLAEIQKYWGFK